MKLIIRYFYKLIAVMLMLAVFGCTTASSGWQHGYNTSKYQGRLLSGESEDGKARITKKLIMTSPSGIFLA